MNNVSFIINGTELCVEKVLAEFEIPLLFICKDKSNKRYSVLCVDSDKNKYLVVESKVYDLVQMIQNTITMKDLFLKAKNKVAWMITAGETLSDDIIETVNINDVDDDDLPADGALYEVYNPEIHDFVDMLLNRTANGQKVSYFITIDTKIATNMQNLLDETRRIKEMRNNNNEQSVTEIVYNS